MSSSKSPPSCYGSPCAACNYLRRKCFSDCVFAPHFPADDAEKFEIACRTYGASNIFKIFSRLRHDERDEAAASLVYEAEARRIDPVYGCVGFISILDDRLKRIQSDLVDAKRELSIYLGSEASAAAASVSIPQFAAGSSSTTPEFLAQLPRLRAAPTRQSLNEQQLLVYSSQKSTIDNDIRQSLRQESVDQPQEMPLVDNSKGFGSNENDQIQIQPHVQDQMCLIFESLSNR
ncbi:LOB domain-containing protein 36-like [Momordica charantia]|uniref:LOB domain-containing protein 36-like n=1 Tax=Momordica charantia TaxID=3673 RepID=A0A6J1CZR4_MOMCH|nr:LOB domain-containing protein 36-like [Momordica charantia]